MNRREVEAAAAQAVAALAAARDFEQDAIISPQQAEALLYVLKKFKIIPYFY